tara:strand:+ start:461 stop:994 length:534 start_codon:yes stop_codon:yes gene_type:complete
MHTLTAFIDTIFEKTGNTSGSTTENQATRKGSQFEVIENERISNLKLEGLTISGSLFSLTTFVGVTFDSCVFFGSKIENCEFVNCNFIDCNFQFSEITHCNFKTTTFKNILWDFTPVKRSKIQACQMDGSSSYYLTKDDSYLTQCFELPLEWDEVPPDDEELIEESGFFSQLLGKAA